MFQPFAVKNFRYQWLADLATSWAFEMETLVLGWYVYVTTGSVLLLTILGSLLFIGTLLSPFVGVGADRIGHRNILCGMRCIYFILSLVMVAAILFDALTPAIALGVAFLMGLVRPSDIGMRTSLVATTIPAQLLVGAMSVSRTTSDSARIFGALTGSGLFAVVGIGVTYGAIAMLYLLGLIMTLLIDSRVSDLPVRATADKDRSPWRDLIDGLGYVWSTPHLQAAMWLAFLVNLTAFPLTIGLLPYVAKEIYGSGETGLGFLIASFSLGALIGSLALSVFGQRVQSARMMVIFAAAWHGCLLVFAFTQTLLVGCLVLAFAGLAQSLCVVPMSIMLMRTSSPVYRGRVMGVRMLAIYGLPIGLVIAGTLIEMVGFQVAMTAYMVTGIICTLLILLRWKRDLWPATAPGNG
ncbi:MAG: MFS transporter [Hyphomicrobiaceae bacterium]